MKFLIGGIFLFSFIDSHVNAYIPIMCSTNGGICKVEDINHFANQVLDGLSNYLFDAYLFYCEHVCSAIKYIFGKKVEIEVPKKSTYYEEILNAVYKKLGWVPEENLKKDSLEDYVCNSSMPFIFIAISFAFYFLIVCLKRKQIHNEDELFPKFDISAYQNNEYDDFREADDESIYTVAREEKICCSCKLSKPNVMLKPEKIES